MINTTPQIIFSALNSEKILLYSYFSKYTNHKEKYNYMIKNNKIINTKDFLSEIKNITDLYSEYNQKEHYLEIGSTNTYKYDNWALLPKELDENFVVIDLGQFIWLEQCNMKTGFVSDYCLLDGQFQSLNITYWYKNKDIYIKVNMNNSPISGKLLIKFYPKKLKLKQQKYILCNWLTGNINIDLLQKLVNETAKYINNNIFSSQEFEDSF